MRKTGMVPIEDYCLFICGFPQCADKCNVNHHPNKSTTKMSNKQIPTWNNKRVHITDYWSLNHLPVTVEEDGKWVDSETANKEKPQYATVHYATDSLSDELLTTSTCKMDYNYPEAFAPKEGEDIETENDWLVSNFGNPFVGDYIYRCTKNSLLMGDSLDEIVMGYGVFRLKADGPNKIKGEFCKNKLLNEECCLHEIGFH